jgi:hypothetical protein
MSAKPTISFVNLDSALKGDVMALAEDGARMSKAVRQKLGGQGVSHQRIQGRGNEIC